MEAGHFVCGTLGGMSGIIIGHPLDTIKVRMQVCQQGGSYMNTFRSIAGGGYGAFYRGITAPLAATSFVTALAFGSKGNMEKYLKRHTDAQTALIGSAACAGLSVAPINCIFEFAKCQVQAGNFSSPLECLRSTCNQHGVRALFPGLSLVYAREVPSMVLYFVVYDMLRRSQTPIFTHETLGPILCGGTAGSLAMGLVHPIDVLKSRYQVVPHGSDIRTVAEVMRQSPQWWSLGLSAALPRAFVANAVCFLAYEKARKWIDFQ